MKYPPIKIKVDETNRAVFGYAGDKQIKAIAICSAEDTFDPHFGTKLVAAKLRKACAKAKLRHLKKIKRELLKQIDAEIADTEYAVSKQTDRVHSIKIEKYPENT